MQSRDTYALGRLLAAVVQMGGMGGSKSIARKKGSKITAESFEPFGTEQSLFAALARDREPMSSSQLGETFAISLVTKKSKADFVRCVRRLDQSSGIDLVDFLFDALQGLEVRRSCVLTAIARLQLIKVELPVRS